MTGKWEKITNEDNNVIQVLSTSIIVSASLDPKTLKHQTGFKILSISQFSSLCIIILHEHVYEYIQADHILLFYLGFNQLRRKQRVKSEWRD